MSRRRLLAVIAGAAAFGVPAIQLAAPQPLRIGYQRSSTLMAWLKSRGALERALAPAGLAPDWTEYPSGLPLLQALNDGAVDLGADVADAVPAFALSAGARLTYYAIELPSPQAQAIVVPAGSGLVQIGQLRGQRIAFSKGAGAHFLVLASLRRASLTLRDVTPVYLDPADGRAAFEAGQVNAWAIWDPYLAAAQRRNGARVLPESVGVSAYRRIYLASSAFARARPEVLEAVYAQLREAGAWLRANPAAAAEWHAGLTGMDVATLQAAHARRSHRVEPVDADALFEQQRIADTFAAEGVVPRRVVIAEVPVWRPRS